MVTSISRSPIFVVFLLLLVFMVQPVNAYDGCSVLPEFFPGREVLQVPLDIVLTGACALHDACYRECTGVPYSLAHKNTCDLLLFLHLEAWCGAVATAQELADIGLSADEFLGPCVVSMGFVYAAAQGPLGMGAYLEDQVPCDPCLNGQFAFDCFSRGGNWDFLSCTCTFNNNCSPLLRQFQEMPNCEFWNFEGGTFCGCSTYSDPILVDLGGNGFHLVGSQNGVSFDVSGDRIKERVGWTRPGSDDAFLVLDRNRNGQIDDGLELFGNATDQPASDFPNGFQALAMFDQLGMGGNGDGKLTAADFIFSHLRLWVDADHDGVSTTGELSSLRDRDVVEIALDYKEARRRDADGNEFRYRVQVTFGNHRKSFGYDVFLSRQIP